MREGAGREEGPGWRGWGGESVGRRGRGPGEKPTHHPHATKATKRSPSGASQAGTPGTGEAGGRTGPSGEGPDTQVTGGELGGRGTSGSGCRGQSEGRALRSSAAGAETFAEE